MLEHSVIAVMHDSDGFISCGYGDSPKTAYMDLEAVLDGEFLDPKMVTFYQKMPNKALVTVE